jgi:hypothetical protein
MKKVKVKESKIDGLGLFTDQEFNEGDIIGLAHYNGVPSEIIGKYHNHSDNPNAHSVSIGNKRYLAALRPLKKGEEITINYRQQPELEQPEEFRKGGLVSMPKPSKKGLASKRYSRDLTATNRLLTKNKLLQKPKSKKRRIYDPNAKYYQDGGVTLPEDYSQFQTFAETLPSNLQDPTFEYGNPDQYDLYGMWETVGKPGSFADVQDSEYFPLDEDGTYHGFTVGSDGTLLKPMSHSTTWKEVMNSQLSTDPYFQENRLIRNEQGRLQYIPKAEYGMPMGTGMSQNYQGRKRFIHQDGGTVELDGYRFKKDASGNWTYESGAPVTDRGMIQRLTYEAKPVGSPVVQSAPKGSLKPIPTRSENLKRVSDLSMSPRIADQEKAAQLSELQREQDIFNPQEPDMIMKPKNMNDLKGYEFQVNRALGFPMDKAHFAAEAAAGDVNEEVDNFRHPLAGRYVAEGIADATGNIPYISPALGFIGSNLLGAGHEFMTLINHGKDKRSMLTRLAESGEDLYNNYVGAKVGASDMTPEEKTNYLLYLSYNNKLPDGVVIEKDPKAKGPNNLYFKKGPNDPGKFKSSYQKGGESRKIKFQPGTYNTDEMAGYMIEEPEVIVSAQASPWGKARLAYQKRNPEEEFIEKKKRQYIRQSNKGLNKFFGINTENFNPDVEQNFRDEYDYNTNTAAVREVARQEGWNPNKRKEYVDDLNETQRQIVANSKYGSKLQPNYWDRSLAGLQELGNTLVPGQPFKYNIPGLTKAEQKQMREDPISALEIFAPANTLGQNIANYVKNTGLSTGSDYKELPGFGSGESMPNVTDADAMGLDPIQMALSIYSGAQLPALATQLPGLISKGVKSAINTAQGIYDAGTDIKGIYNAGKGSNLSFATAPEAQAARALQEAGLLGKNIDPKMFGQYPNLAQNATKRILKNYNTTYRAVTPDVQNLSIDELMNMAKAGVHIDDPVQVSQYMSTHVPMQEFGYRANALMPGVGQDLLYTGKYANAEEAASKLKEYGNYMTEVRPEMDFSEGTPVDWFNNYYRDKPFGINELGEKVTSLQNPGTDWYRGYKPGTIAARRDFEYWPYMGQKGQKLLEPIKTTKIRQDGGQLGNYKKGGEPKKKKRDSKGRYRGDKDYIHTPFTEEWKETYPAGEWAQTIQEIPEVYVLGNAERVARDKARVAQEEAAREGYQRYLSAPHMFNPDGSYRTQAVQSADWLWGLGLGASSGLAKSAVGAAEALGTRALPYIEGALNTSIPGMASIPGATIGNAAAAGFAGDAIVNRLYPSAGKIQEGEYGEAAADIATGILDLAGANMISPLYKGAKATASELGKFIGTEEGLLSNTYKINPFAFKPDPSKFYRQIGNIGLEDALSTQTIRSADQLSFPRPYFVEGKDFKMLEQTGTGAHGRPTVVFETPGVTNDGLPFVSPANASADYTPWIADMAEVPLTEGRLLKQNWLRGYKEVPRELPGSPNSFSIFPNQPTPLQGYDLSGGQATKSIFPELVEEQRAISNTTQPVQEPWRMEPMPGLHLKSTMTDGPISKIVEPKTGLVNVDQALKIIAKESGGEEKVAMIQQALGENVSKKMDYNQFRKVVQDQLIPLDKTIVKGGEYGVDRAGFNLGSPEIKTEKIILSNKDKFGRGSDAHSNPEETLGHVHMLYDAEEPGAAIVTQIQADAFQGTHRSSMKTKEQVEFSLKRMEEHYEKMKDVYEGIIKLPDGTYQLPDGQKISKSLYENIYSGQKEAIDLTRAELKNFGQRQLLDKNHQERYLQEIVQYAAERGDVNRIKLPTAETSAKIQGYFKQPVDDQGLMRKLREDIVDAVDSGSAEDVRLAEEAYANAYAKATKDGKLDYSPEQKTILKKYSENPKIIKKLYGIEPKMITDSKGNTWYEFNIPYEFKEGPSEIKAFNYGGFTSKLNKFIR